jgi:hypothetical protein
MTDQLDHALEQFYADISDQPLTATLEDLTMRQLKKQAARRRLLATFGAGTLVVAAAAGTAVVGLATHQGRSAPDFAPQRGLVSRSAVQASSRPAPSLYLTTVTLTGGISGTMSVTSTQCWPGSPAESAPPGAPAHGQAPAVIEAIGTVNGGDYAFIVEQDNRAEPGAAENGWGASLGLARSKIGGLEYEFTGGVTAFDAGHSTTFNIVLTPWQGNGAAVTAVGHIACP